MHDLNSTETNFWPNDSTGEFRQIAYGIGFWLFRNHMKLTKYLIIVQSVYMLLTGIWPLVHIESFMVVTGPKTDIWLVKTVGAMLIPVALTLLCLINNADRKAQIVLGAGTAIAFGCIDVYYAVNDVISDIYLADAIIQGAFVLWWIVILVRTQ
jgi:hypothetical protein